MKKGISIGDLAVLKKPLKDCITFAKKAGFEGIELSVSEGGDINLNTSADEIKAIADHAKEVGIKIHSITGGFFFSYSMSSENPESREMAKKLTKKQIETASICGADTVLFVPGMTDSSIAGRTETIRYDIAYENAFNGVKEILPYAEELGVHMGIENVANKFLLSPLEMCKFIDDLNSKYIGSYLDVANLVPIPGSPESWIRILGNRIKAIHFKDFKAGAPAALLFGMMDFPAIMEALNEIGYDKWITTEISSGMYYPEYKIHATSLAMDYVLGRK